MKISEKFNIELIHISTDYVFNGKSSVPLNEIDITNPIGVYGWSKLKGEEYIMNSDITYVIIRTSWLYSNFGNNFVKTIIKLAKERSELNIICDQIGTPTYAKDLAESILQVLPKLNTRNKGLYHYSNEGVASWYDFAKEIVSLSKIECTIKPIESKDYNTLSERPNYSVLNKGKIKKVFGIEIPYWRDSLNYFLDKSKE